MRAMQGELRVSLSAEANLLLKIELFLHFMHQ
jgi:hypothetical protein